MDAPAKPEPTATRGAMVAGVVAAAVVNLVRGAIASKLWTWFVVPLGVEPVGWLDATGLVLLVHVALRPPGTAKADDTLTALDVVRGASMSCTLMAIALGFAAVVAVIR